MAETENGVLREKVQSLEVEIARLQEQKKAADQALIIARASLDHAQAQSNEWRATLTDWKDDCPTKNEARGWIDAESAERRALSDRLALLEKDAGTIWIRALVVAGAVIAAVAALQHFWK
jgi:hypothetical protein